MYDYFDVDETCAAEEMVPVAFATASFRLGTEVASARNQAGERSDEVHTGTVATLPLWAASALRESGGFVSILPPSTYSTATFREFKADPLAPNLKAKSDHYYEVGLSLCSMMSAQEAARLGAQIIRLYQLRYMKIIRSAAKRGLDFNDIHDTLCATERQLIDAVKSNIRDENEWRSSAV